MLEYNSLVSLDTTTFKSRMESDRTNNDFRLLELCGGLTSPVSVISSSHELEVIFSHSLRRNKNTSRFQVSIFLF